MNHPLARPTITGLPSTSGEGEEASVETTTPAFAAININGWTRRLMIPNPVLVFPPEP
jgi:hypothetical protein